MGDVREAPAGDFDYEANGSGYAVHRRPDPRIAARVHAALGDARTVINVGAGAGSYEPADRHVVAVEPSAAMRAQRPHHLAPALDATAERLPFDDDVFDAAMATITIHQWSDLDGGLRELRRVSRGPVAILTFDGEALLDFWLNDYVPEVIATEQARFPAIDHVVEALGGEVDVLDVPIPIDCTDGFGEAYYARPEPRPPARPGRARRGGATDRRALSAPRLWRQELWRPAVALAYEQRNRRFGR
jgi:SAM-dependent methyltransferase